MIRVLCWPELRPNTCESGVGSDRIIVLAAVTAPAVNDVSFSYRYETLLAYHERYVPPGTLAFFAGWTVRLAAVATRIAACRSVVAAGAVKVTRGPAGGFWCVGVEPGDLP
jgi:hypothetical protein